MANLNITCIARPKISRNKYGITNNSVIVGFGGSYSGGGSGGGSGEGGTYSDFTGATSNSNGTHGLVPAPTSGQ